MPPLTKPQVRRVAIDTAKVLAGLRTRDRNEQAAGIAIAILGVITLPLGPALAASFTWALAAEVHSLSAWWKHFFICLPIMSGLGFLLAKQGASKAIDDAAGEMSDYGYFARRNLAGMFVLLVVSLLGPGLLVMAYRKLSSVARFRSVSRERAADMLGQMLAVNQGVDIFAILKPGEKLDDVMPTLEYLSHYDWIGISKECDRVWASTEGREKLKIKPA
jgi:hypothetical protein